MIIPELEEAAKSYRRTGVCAYTTEQDDTLLRYCGNVPKDLLMKYFPGKTYGALEGRKRRLIKLQKKKKGATVDKPTDGLYASTPPTKKKPGLNSITSRGNLNRKGKGKHGDLKIPISAVTDKKGYMAAYLLCKRHGWLPYPEALALENKSVENIQKSTEKVTEDPAKGVRPQEIKIQDVAKIQPQNSVVLSHPEIATGMRVRQIKPDAGRQMFGTGVVVSRHGEIVEVRNGSRTPHKILAACLELADGPEKETGAVVSP